MDELIKTKNAIEKGQTPSRYVKVWVQLAVNIGRCDAIIDSENGFAN
jgi:hypothetical protein